MPREIPAKFHYLPAVAATLGISIAFVLAGFLGPGSGYWYSLHSAFTGYVAAVALIGGFTALFAAGLGNLALWRAGKKTFGEFLKPRNWSRKSLSTWLTLAPAGHWFASLSLFLYASRYTPSGGKIIPIVFGVVQILLLALCILSAVERRNNTKILAHKLRIYFALLVLTFLLYLVVGLPIIPWIPLLFWAKLVAVAAIISIAIRRFTGNASQRNSQSENEQQASSENSLSHNRTAISIAEFTGLLIGALLLIVYLLTSQFDTRPTNPLTHCLLFFNAAVYITAGLLFEQNRVFAQLLLQIVGPALLTIALLVLIALHHGDETDPVVIVSVTVFPILILAVTAALAPFRMQTN